MPEYNIVPPKSLLNNLIPFWKYPTNQADAVIFATKCIESLFKGSYIGSINKGSYKNY